MTQPLDEQLRDAMAEFSRQHEALVRARDEAAAISVTVRSKNGAVEVTVSAQGKPTALRFPNNKYQSLSGQELAASVLETLSLAQEEAGARAAALFDEVADGGMGVAGSGALQRLDLDRLLGPMTAEGLLAARPESGRSGKDGVERG
ncbi:YbaB/EbfC family nucleoid-associated protein [Streptomyces mirabilis]|uniref:YbaB/EbfC family nucleoid-associated protein n=1 Tax=Streptomyces mirabilis TaxID=68239 RepID=UPI00332610F1